MGNSHKLFYSLLFFFLILLCTTSCNTVDPPPDKAVLTLTLEDVSCTEAWITLTTSNLQLPATLNLLKDNTITKTIILQTVDTLLYIDSLLPNQTYKFQAVIQSINHSSNEITVTTLDTTSHNFTWQTWTFGEHSNSVLYDVAIINENCIWAVGEIYLNDSLGNPDHNAYNAVHWDGTTWELKRINMLSSCNPITYPPLRAIWAFSENNIVVTSGGSIGWFDGINNLTDCSIRPLLTGSLNKIWGSSSSALYVVGNNGNIAYWSGSNWMKIESGINENFQSIYGSIDSKTQTAEIICVASEEFNNVPTTLIKVNPIDHSAIKLDSQNLIPGMIDIWFRPNRKYITAGSGIFSKNKIHSGDLWIKEVDSQTNKWFTLSIDGDKYNNIIISGVMNEVIHYNGYSWQNLSSQLNENMGRLIRCKINNGLVTIVGITTTTQAVIHIGKNNI